ncbi:hypothetical protein SAMN05421507_1463 [Lentzea jiangxiensis]|uniref:Uncharacterized protein n=1 Tax=Lentzea jiangxiensis TaxID=641025 RepID=A0A1H0X7T1_9PSEU|nr:hypothetical protein SAMN05421507_1463 [Lentzea jiangxiensis]
MVGLIGRLLPDAIAPRVHRAAEFASGELHTVRFVPKQSLVS